MSSLHVSKPSIIPDRVLETLTCRLCNKYLTVSPISVHPDGGSVCGRCLREVNKTSLFVCDSGLDIADQVNIPYTVFGYANHLFPCVNRYEGCTQLLAFEDVSDHEAKCRSRAIKCRYCGYEGAGSQQVSHFKAVHPVNFFERTRFRFPLTYASSNLVKRGEDLFLLDVEFDGKRKQVRFYVEPTKCLEEDVDFFCLVKDWEGEVIDQATSTRRGKRGIYHDICIKEEVDFEENTGMFYCYCLLRRVQQRI